MSNQKLIGISEAHEPPVAVTEHARPYVLDAKPAAGLISRAKSISLSDSSVGLTLLAAEHTAAHVVELPKASARQQAAMMRFAVEDFIAQPLDRVVVSKGPAHRTSPAAQIAFITSKIVMEQHAEITGLFPEFLMVPPPTTEGTWNVWREADRVVVRAFDGVGFAAPMALLEVIWHRAGRPQVYSLAAPMPSHFAAVDLSAAPPPPLPADLAFRFASDHARETQGLMRAALFAGATIFLAAIIHLGIFAIETWALGQQVDVARNDAQGAISQSLPDITVTEDVSPVLARLAPAAAAAREGDFLPLLSDASQAISTTPVSTDTPVSIRRLSWGKQDNRLVLLVQTGALEDLQRIQQGLQSSGFEVTTGAASAGDGGAEAEMRITREGSR